MKIISGDNFTKVILMPCNWRVIDRVFLLLVFFELSGHDEIYISKYSRVDHTRLTTDRPNLLFDSHEISQYFIQNVINTLEIVK